METAHLRSLTSTIAGIFCAVLGLLTLAKSVRSGTNRWFASYCFANAVLDFAPFRFFIVTDPSFAFVVYRFIQPATTLCVYSLMQFVQHLTGVHEETGHALLRRVFLAGSLILVPIYWTPLFATGMQSLVPGDSVHGFIVNRGPLHFLHSLWASLGAIASVISTVFVYRAVSGLKRNQVKFILLGFSLGVFSLVFYVSFFPIAWLTHVVQMAMVFCFAYAIFKYRLFEFNQWMRNATLVLIIYAALISLPFSLASYRFLVADEVRNNWQAVALVIIGYAVLFASAPILYNYVRDKAEEKRWRGLQAQLDIVREASERLAEETGLSEETIPQRTTDILRGFYWDRLKAPPEFVMSAIVNRNGEIFTSVYPDKSVEKISLGRFLNVLKMLPDSPNEVPFSLLDIERKIKEDPDHLSQNLSDIRDFLASGNIDLCCRAFHGDEFRGVLFLGPKSKGIYWPEELTTLQLAASHMATAVHKRELNTTITDLKELDKMKREFVSGITHDLRSPLDVIQGFITLQLSGSTHLTPARQKEILVSIQNNANVLRTMIDNLLLTARLEEKKEIFDHTQFDLNELVSEACKFYEPIAADRKIPLNVALSNRQTFAWGDRDKVLHVLYNLLSNAYKFTKEGRISVSVHESPEEAEVRVTDTGSGVPADDKQKIFERFYRSPSNAKKAKGTGLGLSIVKDLIEGQNGRVGVSDNPGGGSIFFFTLPR